MTLKDRCHYRSPCPPAAGGVHGNLIIILRACIRMGGRICGIMRVYGKPTEKEKTDETVIDCDERPEWDW